MRRRIERLFGEAKEQMGLRRARRRGLEQVQEQCLMTAMAQNIKRIVKLSNPKVLFPIKLGLSSNKCSVFKALLTYFMQKASVGSQTLVFRIVRYFDQLFLLNNDGSQKHLFFNSLLAAGNSAN